MTEVERVMRAAVEEARGRVGVVGDAGYGTAIAIEFAKAAERAGADAILLLPPYLLGVEQAGLEAHVDAVCSAIGIGIVIYDRDNAIYSLAERHKNLIGYKDGRGDVEQLVGVRQMLGDRLVYIGGLLPGLRRYNVVIGYANEPLQAGSWVHEALLSIPEAPPLDRIPVATRAKWSEPALEGYTFEGYRNFDGSVGTRNVLAITTTVQCVAGVVDHAVRQIRSELLPRFPNVDDAIGLEHIYGCGVAIDAPDADIPIRTLRYISRNPNFAGGLMVVGLGCEKLQPERLLPPGTVPARMGSSGDLGFALVRLQDEPYVGFEAMIAAIMAAAAKHLARLHVDAKPALHRRSSSACSAAAVMPSAVSPPILP
jgi:D-galactarate dehydratase/Altronate hydrolase, second domain/Dihydrodipicolinate synthetase family